MTPVLPVAIGEPSWAEDRCEDLSAPVCPAGYRLNGSGGFHLCALTATAVLCSPLCHSVTRQPLLLVSLDGLRPEYLQSWHTLLPVLDKLGETPPGP